MTTATRRSTNSTKSFALVAAALAASLATMSASAEIYMRAQGISGDVTRIGYEQWIDLSKVGYDISVPASSGGAGGLPQLTDVSVTKLIDAATIALLDNITSGRHIPTVDIAFVQPCGDRVVEPFRINLEDVLLTGMSHSADTGSTATAPIEDVKLSFARIRWTYQRFDARCAPVGTPMQTGYDVAAAQNI